MYIIQTNGDTKHLCTHAGCFNAFTHKTHTANTAKHDEYRDAMHSLFSMLDDAVSNNAGDYLSEIIDDLKYRVRLYFYVMPVVGFCVGIGAISLWMHFVR